MYNVVTDREDVLKNNRKAEKIANKMRIGKQFGFKLVLAESAIFLL